MISKTPGNKDVYFCKKMQKSSCFYSIYEYNNE